MQRHSMAYLNFILLPEQMLRHNSVQTKDEKVITYGQPGDTFLSSAEAFGCP